MNFFGSASRAQLDTVDPRLKNLAYAVLRIKDHSIIKGYRNEDEQNSAFDSGTSKLPWPRGKHNRLPSLAMDVQTHPRPSNPQKLREEQFYLLGLYKGIAEAMGIKIRCGGDWDCDGEVSDNGWDDLFHVEIAQFPFCGFENEKVE